MPIRVIFVDVSGAEFSAAEKYLPCVSQLRRNRISKKRSDSDKLLALTAGLLVSSELSRMSGIPRDKLRYEHGTFGKPYLSGSDVQFSISHTAGAVCAAFSVDGEVGADIERKSRRVSERLFARVLSDAERPLVSSGEEFIRIWVQKEAFLKRLGTGIADDLRGADTSVLKDTALFDCGDYYVGISGRGAENAEIITLTLEQLLAEFD